MVGRKPKPSALKLLQGNPGKRGVNKKEPRPSGIPECPSHLDKVAHAEWNRLVPELTRLGLLTSVDRAALAAYCSAYSRWVQAEKMVAKFGTVIESPKSGYPVQNPHVSVANTALDHMRKFLIEFGMTPASRARLQVEPPTDGDRFAAFMQTLGDIDDDGSAEEQAQ